MNKTVPVVTFLFGAIAGATTSWLVLKKIYQTKAEVEIESVRKTYREHAQNNVSIPVDGLLLHETEDNIPEAVKYAREKIYIPEIPEIKKTDRPYVIPPDEFGELYDYEKVYLSYFADGAVADNEYEILTTAEIEDSIGLESLTHFGDYDDDLLHVRNDIKRCDYEIAKDLRNYSELTPEDY